MEEIAKIIMLRRKKLHLSKQEVKKRSGVSVQQLSNIENGLNVSVNTLNKILDVLGLKIELQLKDELNY